MNLDEWLSFLMASERTQKPFWDRVLQESYKFTAFSMLTKETTLIDLPIISNGNYGKCYSIL